MNLVGLNLSGEFNSSVLFVNFNQDYSSLSVGLKYGYKLYSLKNIDASLDMFYHYEGEEIRLIERLFSSSLIALVTVSSPRTLKVYHFKKGQEIVKYSYPNVIQSVKLNRNVLIVCLDDAISIHNIQNMHLLHSINEIPYNPHGLCVLSIADDSSLLCYPADANRGVVAVYDALQLKGLGEFQAHDNPLAALSMDSYGSKIATASNKGTVIRIFAIPSGERLHEFRRGVMKCVVISSLSFSTDGNFLCCSSNSETVHIFKLVSETERSSYAEKSQSSSGWMGVVQGALKSSTQFLPSQVTEMMNQDRDFASAKLPSPGMRSICALSTLNATLRLLIGSEDGYLYVFNVDRINGGECSLCKQYRLDGAAQSADHPQLHSTATAHGTSASTAASSGGASASRTHTAPNTYTSTVASPLFSTPATNIHHSSIPYKAPPSDVDINYLEEAAPLEQVSSDDFASLDP